MFKLKLSLKENLEELDDEQSKSKSKLKIS